MELSTLKNNNARLTAALQESTANVEEWKKQLQAYKEENQRMKQRVLEAEAARGIFKNIKPRGLLISGYLSRIQQRMTFVNKFAKI